MLYAKKINVRFEINATTQNNNFKSFSYDTKATTDARFCFSELKNIDWQMFGITYVYVYACTYEGCIFIKTCGSDTHLT